jgi:hypothetical protein
MMACIVLAAIQIVQKLYIRLNVVGSSLNGIGTLRESSRMHNLYLRRFKDYSCRKWVIESHETIRQRLVNDLRYDLRVEVKSSLALRDESGRGISKSSSQREGETWQGYSAQVTNNCSI